MAAGGRMRERRRKILAAALLGILAGLLVVFGTGPYGWINMVRVNRRQDRLRRELLVNMVRNELMRREIKRMKEDSLYLESKARERYGMVKPGETSIRFYQADSLKSKP
jgi:cell division protein FtsB